MLATLDRDLLRLGHTLQAWRARLRLVQGAAALLAFTLLLGLFDLVFKTGPVGRWLAFAVLLALAGTLCALITLTLRRRFTTEGVAATLEHAFPELDNRLINYIQFARDGGTDPFKRAYLQTGAPALRSLDLTRMKNRKAERRSLLALAITATLLVLPLFFWGTHWPQALWRMVNPLTTIAPVTLTRIITIEPGDLALPQGSPVLLVATVQGLRGHTVQIEVDTDDARRSTVHLGSVASEPAQSFSHRIHAVNTRLRYRFRAGDAPPSPWHTITPFPPPAFTQITLAVVPPAYTRLPPAVLDARDAVVPVIPAGAHVTLFAETSTTLTSMHVTVPGDEPAPMQPDGRDTRWQAGLTITQPGTLQVRGTDSYGQPLGETIPFTLKPDQSPVIDITFPAGPVVLPPGEPPQIEFSVRDDYGISAVHLEQIDPGAKPDEHSDIVATWDPGGRPSMSQTWRGPPSPLRPTVLTFRLTAADNTPGHPQLARSEPIVFTIPSTVNMNETRDLLETEALDGLERVIALQKLNIESTRQHSGAPTDGTTDVWSENEQRQREIRSLTRTLLQNPLHPLGGRAESVSHLYANEMILAIDALAMIPSANPDDRARRTGQAIDLQSAILRGLSAAEFGTGKTRTQRRLSGISAMLQALIEGQARLVSATGAAVTDGRLDPTLAVTQDDLAEAVTLFETACRQDAEALRGSDAAFAERLDTLAAKTGERRIREDMLLAAEQIERNQATAAHAFAARAHAGLKDLERLLNQITLQQGGDDHQVRVEALAQARESLETVEAIHDAMRVAMDTLRGHTDKRDALSDIFAEEFMEIVRKNREALLEIPVDLHVFTDLNVANELLEDVFSIFQEVEQIAGTDRLKAEDGVEMAYAKNLEALEAMREMKDRFDDVEKWLEEEPDREKVVTEALDREEMPEAGIALGALAAAMEDLIGDLLDESDENMDTAQDGATTHAKPDIEAGWKVEEGDIASFGAKGASGNQAPDHKEQDGRANVGRQGMSSGETAAGSGTIGEGDDLMDERRTEDPVQAGQVQLEGEADTAATGGGKQSSGKAEDAGMSGGVRRMDSTEEGSQEGMAAMLARQVDAIYAQAALHNIRLDSLETVLQHLRQMDDAIAQGDIRRIEEHKRSAAEALQGAQARLAARPSAALDMDNPPPRIQDAVQSSPDLAPVQYRNQVAEYYKLLNENF